MQQPTDTCLLQGYIGRFLADDATFHNTTNGRAIRLPMVVTSPTGNERTITVLVIESEFSKFTSALKTQQENGNAIIHGDYFDGRPGTIFRFNQAYPAGGVVKNIDIANTGTTQAIAFDLVQEDSERTITVYCTDTFAARYINAGADAITQLEGVLDNEIGALCVTDILELTPDPLMEPQL